MTMLRYLGKRTNIVRRFSTEKTTDEKAAELSKDAWPRIKKYGFLIAPTVLFTVISIDIINDLHHRKVLEEIWPSYVNFVRKYYGFKDEDKVELQRINCVRTFQRQPVNVVVNLGDGRTKHMELPDVAGEKPINELEELIQSRITAEFGSHYEGIRSVSFEDTIISDMNTLYSESNSELVSSIENRHATDVPSALAIAVTGISPWYSSLWAGPPIQNLKARREQLSGLTNPGGRCERAVLDVRYENYALDTVDGIKAYKAYGNGRIYQIQDDTSRTRNLKPHRQKKTSISASDTSSQKYQAQEAIKRIETQIRDLENEKRIGRREIDDIEKDIRYKKLEIQDIRRKHLSYFGFF